MRKSLIKLSKTNYLLLLTIISLIAHSSIVQTASKGTDSHVIKVGLNTGNQPIAYQDNGQMKGIFTDVIKEVAKHYDWDIEIVPAKWLKLNQMLASNQIDILAGVGFDESRLATDHFSNETVFNNWATIWTNNPKITGLRDLEGKKIAVAKSSIYYTGDNGIRKVLSQFQINATFVVANSYYEVYQMLKNKTADAGVVNRFSALKYGSNFKLIDTKIIFNPIELRFATNINRTDLQYVLNDIDVLVHQWKADPNSVYYQILDKYFGVITFTEKPSDFLALIAEIMAPLIPIMLILIVLVSRIQVRRKTKELLKAKNSQMEFFSNINHELRSPIHALSGFIDLIQNTNLTSDQEQYLKAISRANNNLSRIVSDVLTISQLQKGNFSFQKEKFYIKDVIDFIIPPLEQKAILKGLKIYCTLGHSLNKPFFDDQLRFSEILINLIENSIKFTKQGSVSCFISLLSYDKKKTSIEIKIIDTGIGIDQEFREKIFSPFFKGDMMLDNTSVKGIGLGLAIVRHLLEKFNGNIEIESELGKGTTFIINLNLENYSNQKVDEKNGTADENNLEKEEIDKILLVDDIEDNLILLEMMLNKIIPNVSILKSSNGNQVLELVKNNRFKLIFMDLRMPEMDGFEINRQIKNIEYNEGISTTPIIAVTAYISEIKRKRLPDEGFDGILEKPFTINELESILKSINKSAN